MTLDFDFILLSLVFMRMSGCVLFNPILGRQNIPMPFRIGLTVFMTLFTYTMTPAQVIAVPSTLIYMFFLVKELLIGLMVGYIVQLFLSVILIGGEVMDMQMGISMSKIYDPASNISMPLTASLINVMFMLIFFSANGHVALVEVFVRLGSMVPYGELSLPTGFLKELVGLFSAILVYGVKMALPVLAVEIVVEISVGLLMKAVPQINVFVVNIQLKIFIGFLAILVLVPAFSNFLERLIDIMFDKIHMVFGALA